MNFDEALPERDLPVCHRYRLAAMYEDKHHIRREYMQASAVERCLKNRMGVSKVLATKNRTIGVSHSSDDLRPSGDVSPLW